MVHRIKDVFLHGRTTVGERGQIVIPQSIRKAMKIKPRDEMMVMSRCGRIIVMPADAFESYFQEMFDQMQRIRSSAKR